jgi:hypothetical protein
VPTFRFHVLYVFLVLADDRRRILHFNVTAHRPRSGPDSNCWRPFPLPNSRVTYCATAMRPSATTSERRCEIWASATFSRHRARPGSEPM